MQSRASKFLNVLIVTMLTVNHVLSKQFMCTFDQGMCSFFNSSDHPWTRYSGPTPSSATGPSSDHTTGAGFYMYVEASTPNFPDIGPFELEASFVNVNASSIFFWYNMYGQSMGSLTLQVYSNVSGWVDSWSKYGDQGTEWQMATVYIGTIITSRIKFVAYTGSDFTGDMAIDDINAFSPTPAPSVSTSPSSTTSPSLGPSPLPTHAPTTVLITTASQLQNALESSNITVSVNSDIALSRVLYISNVSAVRILGNNFEINGGGITRCISVINAEISISNLVISNGFSYYYGGGMYIDEYSHVTLLSCIFSQNVAYYLSGGAIYADGFSSFSNTSATEDGKFIVLMLQNCSLTGNSGSFGGAIVFNFQVDATMIHCTISENFADSYGGGVLAMNGANLTMLECSVQHNFASNEGGGIAFYGASVFMERCSISNNLALDGGGLIADSSSDLSCTETSFLNNIAVRGAGVYIGGSSTLSTFFLCVFADNVASEGSGAGLYISSGSVSIMSSGIVNNTGSGAYFTLISGAADGCYAVGGCFYSPNYPSDYGADSSCVYKVQGNGTLKVITFNTEVYYDYLTISGEKYFGRVGPECVNVFNDDILTFSADVYTESSGFEICFSETSSGGGLYVIGGAVHLNNVTIANNAVSHHGGGLYVDGGSVNLEACVLENNKAASGKEVYFISGEFKASGLGVHGSGRLFDGASAYSGTECSSSCKQGTWGNCTQLLGTEKCFANCRCENCPKGAISSTVGATSPSVCTLCGAGQVPDNTGTSCSSCLPGTFATDNPADVSGGVSRQVALGATFCNACPRGRFAAHSSALVCQRCVTGRSSSMGSANCTLCDANYYAVNHNCFECTARLQCLSSPGRKLPGPQKGYWVDLNDIGMQGDGSDVTDVVLYQCTRATCKGVDPNNSSCWSLSSKELFVQCLAEEMCLTGSVGPLCGGCKEDYIFSPTDAVCSSCSSHIRRAAILAVTILILIIVACLIYFEYITIPEQLKQNCVIRSLLMVDGGTLRVAYSTYQITSSVAWTSETEFPQPFAKMLQVMSIFSLDFLDLSCVQNASVFTTVIVWSLFPVALEVFCLILYFIRRARAHTRVESKEILRQHSGFFFVMTYAVMPPICRHQFQVLDCINITGNDYLRSDTTVDCNSAGYNAFKILDVILILGWMSVPLIWLSILYRKRHRLNPSNAVDMSHALRLQRADKGLNASSFLWAVYQPTFYYWEAVEVYRRVFFVGIVPLISSNSSRRAAFGLFAAICSAVSFRELEPFRVPIANLLSHVAQYVIILNYGAALCISTGVSDNLNPLIFGLILVIVNLVVVGLAFYSGAKRQAEEMKSNQWWRRDLNSQEIAVVHAVMQGHSTPSQCEISTQSVAGVSNSGIAMVKPLHPKKSANGPSVESDAKNLNGDMPVSEDRKVNSVEILQRYLVNVDDVVVSKRVGAGTFGEVFSGSVLGRPVAIKTMLKVNEENALTFRAEILLMATLKHANIVGFVGACWSRELVALLLEWVPRGSLGDLLGQNNLNLAWNDPLLRLASDIARGMAYLHSRSFFDEQAGKQMFCILHRDLKPDNALVTEFMSSKITDFGTSRAKSQSCKEVAMTAIGTPLFCAPEILNGEIYDEKVDVYSYGMLLLSMCVEAPLLEYLSARWCVDFNKKHPPNQPMRIIRMIMNGSWRTFTAVPQAPPKLNALLVQCLEVKPQERPSFEQILSELNGPIKDEIDENNFIRQPVGSHIHASGLHGSAENGGSLINDNISMHGGVIPVDQPEADIDTDAKFMRNPMLSTGFRGTNDSRLSQRFSQCDIMSEVELSRVEVVTRTEV